MASYRFRDFELDSSRYELRRQGRNLRLEKIPMDLLILLLERNGDLITRGEIIERIWGKDVFTDSDAGINTAIRKIRQTLNDDPKIRVLSKRRWAAAIDFLRLLLLLRRWNNRLWASMLPKQTRQHQNILSRVMLSLVN